MAIYFLDSSAIVKRYANEAGTIWITEVMDPVQGHRLHAASIALVEVTSALVRRQRAGGTERAALAAACRRFREEFDNLFAVVELSYRVVNQAAELAERHGLRGYDAVQLAAATQVHAAGTALGLSCTLISADTELNTAALAEGLPIIDPTTRQ